MILTPIISKQLVQLFNQLQLSKKDALIIEIIKVLTKLSESETIQFIIYYTTTYIEEKHLLKHLTKYKKSIRNLTWAKNMSLF